MSINFQILGTFGRDNAAFARIETGQHVYRLLFDCGYACPDALAVAELQAVDHLLFSHLHMDHIAGFDSFFRHVFNRTELPNCVWGPPETGRIMQHRFAGVMWNWASHARAVWRVHDIHPDHILRWRCNAREAFARLHADGQWLRSGPIFAHADYSIDAVTLNHGIPTIGYIVREAARVNVDPVKLAALGLRSGPWLALVKQPRADEPTTISIDGAEHSLAALRAALLVTTPGESLAYLTDFTLDEAEIDRLVPVLRGCTTLICESQYRVADADLAARNHHMTSVLAATLAARAEVGRLVLFHISDRYERRELPALLEEARAVFPNTSFAEHWRV